MLTAILNLSVTYIERTPLVSALLDDDLVMNTANFIYAAWLSAGRCTHARFDI